MLLENIGWKTGCVAGKYGLENKSCLLENRGWKTSYVWRVIAGYGLTC